MADGNGRPTGLRLAGIGIEFAGTILAALFLGNLIDRRFGWQRPWGTVVGVLLGLTIGLARIVMLSRKYNQ